MGGGAPGVEFLGEKSVTGFINGLELATQIGLTEGTAQFSNEPWLHFILDDVELYIAKKTYCHSITWDHIDAAGAVFGSKTVDINGHTYKVRLPKSVASGDIYIDGNLVYDPLSTWDSEWNRLMYSIHSGNHTNVNNPTPVSGEGIQFGTLAQYTDTDLVVHNDVGNGSYSWCQETPSSDTTRRVVRGFNGVSYLAWNSAWYINSYNGWRPVLELVS